MLLSYRPRHYVARRFYGGRHRVAYVTPTHAGCRPSCTRGDCHHARTHLYGRVSVVVVVGAVVSRRHEELRGLLARHVIVVMVAVEEGVVVVVDLAPQPLQAPRPVCTDALRTHHNYSMEPGALPLPRDWFFGFARP